MANDREVFNYAIVSQLAGISWENPNYRRTIAAILVQGTYDLQHDRQSNNIGGPLALAPPWWQSFGFKLSDKLFDDRDGSIFGAIYEYEPLNTLRGQNPPRYVVAFRGTTLRSATIVQDLKNDLKILRHELHTSGRISCAREAVKKFVDLAGAGNVWLAGHSLGSSIALLVGKYMAADGFLLETYLFNPPFPSFPLKLITKNKMLTKATRTLDSYVTAGLLAVLGRKLRHGNHTSFSDLSEWKPNLFINPNDLICREYKGYFEHRETMRATGAGRTEDIATQYTKREILYTFLGMDRKSIHLIPSACLTIIQNNNAESHGIKQWYITGINMDAVSTVYVY